MPSPLQKTDQSNALFSVRKRQEEGGSTYESKNGGQFVVPCIAHPLIVLVETSLDRLPVLKFGLRHVNALLPPIPHLRL